MKHIHLCVRRFCYGWVVGALLGLCSCKEGEKDPNPVVVVDPGPPFCPCRPQLRAIHILDDGSVVVVMEARP